MSLVTLTVNRFAKEWQKNMEMEKKYWWQSSVIYQIYPRSFMDSNNDGIGDLRGIISKLDYLKTLGIDAIWLSPVYKSPQDDNGYDISDYTDIDPMFGNLEDMTLLISKAKEYGIQIIMDLVLNHTSDEHPWFIEAKKSRDNLYHDYYVWVDGEEGILPNDLKACFGGSAWEWVPERKQYYLHQFSVRQPDLNWENPKLRAEIYKMICWWINKGVGGFRLDVIDLIGKEPLLGITSDGPHLHEYIKELNLNTWHNKDLLTVGETWSATPKTAEIYSNPDGSEFSMVFQFEHILLDQQEGKSKWDLAPLDFMKLKQVLSKWQTELSDGGWNSLFWNNHDLPRIVSRWGNDGQYREESAKMLATIIHGMKGTPYIYQGEELGMTNVRYDISEYRDIETLNLYKERLEEGYEKEDIMASIYAKGRDNARTPMQWELSANAGFSQMAPWIKVNPNYLQINAGEQLLREDSVFHYYRQLIALRKKYEVIRSGNYELLYAENPQIFAYQRTYGNEKLKVICNFTDSTANICSEDFKNYELLLCNYPATEEEHQLRPYEARMYINAVRRS
ncbi:glucan 1,6-alpha-glucosidase [Anaerocolumna xylanovorans DSM 12503]|uniref:Glucan 1,6-alpha-glucosidase n=2 Tax=Anaerocolumna TaxID=1843210 RepID=A0A1M7Y4T4_9FIRM|nr:alpha-glucosidase [Anaerocolumna xylanovorans]SHO47373.1 glucan 1,6-alpha-glucosidase [Anaerocolumna xylanovorans DSM 12503]